MKKTLLNFLKDTSVESAFQDEDSHLSWRKYNNQNFNDPDSGLIFQYHPWAIDDIERYNT